MSSRTVFFLVLIFIGLVVLVSTVFIVDEREQVIITRLDKPIRDPIKEPGIYAKIPIIDKANYFPKYLLEWDGDPGEFPTLDKTFIWVDTFARWRVVDPLTYFKSAVNEQGAQRKLDDIIDPAVRNAITSHRLIETVRNSNRLIDTREIDIDVEEGMESRAPQHINFGRDKITEMILDAARPKMAQFGIELVDVRIKRINYTEKIQKSVYQRMIQERRQIAEKYRSEGQGESNKIAGEMEKELKKITSGAYRKAQEVQGAADAEAARLYAEAFSKDPDFYSFLNTLEVYRDTFDEETWLLLSTDSDFLRYLKEYED
jgi:membrane protease subunit HflC